MSLQTAGLTSLEGAVSASDTGQCLPLTSDRSAAEGELPTAWLGLLSPSADSPPSFASLHTSDRIKSQARNGRSVPETPLPTQPEYRKGR